MVGTEPLLRNDLRVRCSFGKRVIVLILSFCEHKFQKSRGFVECRPLSGACDRSYRREKRPRYKSMRPTRNHCNFYHPAKKLFHAFKELIKCEIDRLLRTMDNPCPSGGRSLQRRDQAAHPVFAFASCYTAKRQPFWFFMPCPSVFLEKDNKAIQITSSEQNQRHACMYSLGYKNVPIFDAWTMDAMDAHYASIHQEPSNSNKTTARKNGRTSRVRYQIRVVSTKKSDPVLAKYWKTTVHARTHEKHATLPGLTPRRSNEFDHPENALLPF